MNAPIRGLSAGLAWLISTGAPPARAELRVVALAPPATQVEFTTYAMGMFALPGRFARFTGSLQVDTAGRHGCTVVLDVEVASLTMADADRVRLALGPKLLDQPSYPHLLYAGVCTAGQATGELTLHGVTRPFALATHREGNIVSAEGTLKRAEYGVDGLPGLIGRTIKIRFTVALPDGIAALMVP